MNSSEKPSAATTPPTKDRLKKSRIGGGSAAVLAVPPSNVSSLGGVLILGARQITYHHTGEGITRTLPVSDRLFLTNCVVEEKRAIRRYQVSCSISICWEMKWEDFTS